MVAIMLTKVVGLPLVIDDLTVKVDENVRGKPPFYNYLVIIF